MDLSSFILPELLILVPVLYALGYALKRNKKFTDESIPLVLCICGIILAFMYIVTTQPLNTKQALASAIFTAFTQGILAAATAVLSNQLIKQGEKFNNENLKEDYTDTDNK